MSKVAVIYMGGTFGCVGSPLSPMPHTEFLPQLQSIIRPYSTVDFDCYAAPDIIDSSACTAKTWLRLIQFIQQLQHEKQIQKFIIIHGTDTLSYASAVLTRFLAQSCTVILTGSQYPLLNTDGSAVRTTTDALDNLRHALEHISHVTSGVHLSFNGQLFHGHSVIKYHTTALHAFKGVSSTEQLTKPQIAHIVTDADITRAETLNIMNLMLQPTEQQQLQKQLQLIATQAPDFLILQGFGTGNIATNPQIVQHIKHLQQQNCLAILTTQVTFGSLDQRYAISQWVKDADIMVSDGIGHADLYAKILKLYLTYQHVSQYRQHWADAT
ncbi:asparaginase domain-containing protein [Acinetobacter rathckeae]|uniref:asparaginase domain-containing protein n=1 Tax=Acinetobacter rathckeae TaxID=2605272 RepID=UPI0018A26DBB|nr:asparaginase domain-containing protein [Acinetobacter rathckeae]MBF7688457.1 asparaginase [Acinetobacter rathckeae]MBF7695541.1 asparaginase [Acinetobacter rathckeae]